MPHKDMEDSPGGRPDDIQLANEEVKEHDLAFPDGGLEAWLQVLGSFFCLMNTW